MGVYYKTLYINKKENAYITLCFETIKGEENKYNLDAEIVTNMTYAWHNANNVEIIEKTQNDTWDEGSSSPGRRLVFYYNKDSYVWISPDESIASNIDYLSYFTDEFYFPCSKVNIDFKLNFHTYSYYNDVDDNFTFRAPNLKELSYKFSIGARTMIFGDNVEVERFNSYASDHTQEHAIFGENINVGENAFINSEAEISINSINNVGKKAFYYAKKLQSEIIINGNIGDGAFEGTELSKVDIRGENINVGENAFINSKAEISLLTLNNVGKKAFSNAKKLQSEIIINGNIGDGAFEGTEISKAVINESYISEAAFSNCKKLEQVELNGNNIEIGQYAFNGCDELTSIDLKNVNILHEYAFNGCNNLTKIYNFNEDYGLSSCIFIVETETLTYVTGDEECIHNYDWGYDNRILDESRCTLNIENNNNEWISIPLSSDNTGQLKFKCDDNILTCHLTDDLETKYTGLCVCADKKWYQFKD